MKAFALCFVLVVAVALFIFALGHIAVQWVRFMGWLSKKPHGFKLSMLIYMLICAVLLWIMGVGQL